MVHIWEYIGEDASVVAQYDRKEEKHYLQINGEEHGPFTDAEMSELKSVMRAYKLC